MLFKHVYFTSIEKKVRTTYTNLSRFCFLGTTPVLAPNMWANEEISKLTPAPGNRTRDLKDCEADALPHDHGHGQMLFEGLYKTQDFFRYFLYSFSVPSFIFSKNRMGVIVAYPQRIVYLFFIFFQRIVSLMVNLFSTKCFLFVYMYIDLLTLYLTWQYWALPIQQKKEI